MTYLNIRKYSTWILFILVGFSVIGCVPYSYNPDGTITSYPNNASTNPYEGSEGCGANCRSNYDASYRDDYYRDDRYYDDYRYYNDNRYYDDDRDRWQYRRLKKSPKSATEVNQHKKVPKYAPATNTRKLKKIDRRSRPVAKKRVRKLKPSRKSQSKVRRSTTRKYKSAKKREQKK